MGSQVSLLNTYGPTECTVISSYFDVTDFVLSDGLIPIGKRIAGGCLVVLDKCLSLVPLGAVGELHIGGAGLARGYLNQPDLTEEKFILNPFYDEADRNSSKRLYKTGDLVRWLPDGNLEFLGRIDHQVKIRGFRIELAEIEHALTQHDSIKNSIVLAKENALGDKHLVAYVVIDNVGKFEKNEENTVTLHHDLIEALRYHLNQILPEYMVPSAFVLLESLPLTPNGKINRKALPEPDTVEQQAVYVEPDSDTEKVLCDIWQDILGVEQVGITDNFFKLGGHSLDFVNLQWKIRVILNVDIEIFVLYSRSDVKQQAELIDTYLLVSLDQKVDIEEALIEEEF